MTIELTKEEFSKKIENYVKDNNSTYMDATIAICEKMEIEFTIISKLLNKPILEKIQEEGRSLNLLPKSKKNKLPFAWHARILRVYYIL